jgi:thiamine biosynthesis lipoprotein
MLTYSHKAMDTTFQVSFGADEDPALCASAAGVAFQRIDELEGLLSRFVDTSDVAVIRALAPGEVAVLAPETMEVLVCAARVCAATGGAFDPTVGPVMARIRHEGRDGASGSAAVRWDLSEDERTDVFARGGMQRLILDVENRRVAVTPDRLGRPTPLELDFGGIGKGFALDVCREILTGEQFGLRTFLLDAGTSTQWAQGAGWRVGTGGEWKDRTRLETVLTLDGAAFSGSGFDRQGAHVVDVRRGAAADRWAHAWVWCATSAAVADALSTASFALAPHALRAAARDLSARILVARRQARVWDRFRDPLVWYD